MAARRVVRNDHQIAHEVIQANIDTIKDSGLSVDRVADKLLAKRIISDGEYQTSKDRKTGETTRERLSRLIDIVRESLEKGDGEDFQILLDIIRGENTKRFDKLAEKLEKGYDTLYEEKAPSQVETQQQLSTSSQVLGIEDKEEVIAMLTKHNFQTKSWFRLFGTLGLSHDARTTIETDHSRSIARQMEEGIATWLLGRYNTDKYGRPSWSRLVKGLKDIQENAVAEGVERDKCR